MRKFSTLLAAASVVTLSMVGQAAEITTPAATGGSSAAATQATTGAPSAMHPATPPSAVSEVSTKGRPIVLEVSKGLLIRLPHAASTVFIANPEVADVQMKSPSLIYLAAKAPGETALYAVDAEDHVMMNSPVRVEQDLERVRDSMRALAPGEDVQVSSLENSLVLNGKVSSAGEAEKVNRLAAVLADETKGKVINRLSVVTPNQVNIRVKVAEVNRQVLKALGVNWEKLAGNITFFTQNPVTSGAIVDANALTVAMGGHNAQMLAQLDALAQEGLVTTLAEPNLTATNGQPASFLAGGEFPVPVAGAAAASGGIPTITIAFKTFGVSLDVTPTIIDAQHIIMRVRPEVSQLSTTGEVSVPLSATQTVTIPALTVSRAETTVELGSGQSFLLGGLLQNTTTQNISKIPWLGDLPILGQLFRSQQFQHNESELVIVVTPYLVQPTLTSMATPTDGFVAAHDLQQIISGATYRQGLPPPANGPAGAGAQGLLGPAGFRLD